MDEATASVTLLLTVLTRDEAGDEPADPRRTVRLRGVSRLVASYRHGPGDDPDAPVLPLDVGGLRDLLRRHGGSPVHGWEFVDAEGSWRRWRERLSLDLALGGPGGHHLTLFQDLRGMAHLDLRVWFAELGVLDGDGTRLDLDAFIAGGARWWEAMYAGIRSDLAPSIMPAAPDPAAPPDRARARWRRFRRTSE